MAPGVASVESGRGSAGPHGGEGPVEVASVWPQVSAQVAGGLCAVGMRRQPGGGWLEGKGFDWPQWDFSAFPWNSFLLVMRGQRLGVVTPRTTASLGLRRWNFTSGGPTQPNLKRLF